ncbi:MAG: hypothetical protein ACRDL7_02020, partial [Gaiellaceae bacterium]
MTHRTGHRPDKQQEQRQQYELRPARDLDRYRRGRRHPSDGNGGTTRIQGNLALDWWEEPPQCDKVPRDMPSSRPNRRRRVVERHQARAARRARRVALLVVLSAVFLVALGLTAFGSTTSRTAAIIPRQSLATVAQTQPTTEIVALQGPVRLQ